MTIRLDRMNFTKLSRQAVGHHMLDSGDIYGRNYQKPVIDKVTIDIDYNEYQDEFYVSASIPLGAFLDAAFDIDKNATKILRKLGGHRLNSRDAAEAYCKATGQNEAFDNGQWFNSYNVECDLDQVYQCYTIEDNEGMLYFIETHNGCDVRGGYSEVLVAREVSEYSYDISARWCVAKAYIAGVENPELVEEYRQHDCSGDSLNWLVNSVDKEAKLKGAIRIDENTVKLILTNGHELEVYAVCPAIENWG